VPSAGIGLSERVVTCITVDPSYHKQASISMKTT
jgi:hypothetical protein